MIGNGACLLQSREYSEKPHRSSICPSLSNNDYKKVRQESGHALETHFSAAEKHHLLKAMMSLLCPIATVTENHDGISTVITVYRILLD